MTSCVRQLRALCGGQLGECAVKWSWCSADSPPQSPRELGSERMQLRPSYTYTPNYIWLFKKIFGKHKVTKALQTVTEATYNTH